MRSVASYKYPISLVLLLFAACLIVASDAFASAVDNRQLTADLLAGSGRAPGWTEMTRQTAASLPGQGEVNAYPNGTMGAANFFSPGSAQPHSKTQRTDKGAAYLEFNSDNYVPGSFLNIDYQTMKNTLQGNVDIYLESVYKPPFFRRGRRV
jgi:hypothetical protein